jgi:hypothetical protein
MPLQAKAWPTADNGRWRQQGHAAIKILCTKKDDEPT